MDVTRFLRADGSVSNSLITEARDRLKLNGGVSDVAIEHFMTVMVRHVIDGFKGDRDHKKEEYSENIYIENGSKNQAFMAMVRNQDVSRYVKLAILNNCIESLEQDVVKFNDIPGGAPAKDMLKYSHIEVEVKHHGWFRFVFYYFDNDGLDNYQVHVGMRKLTWVEYFRAS